MTETKADLVKPFKREVWLIDESKPFKGYTQSALMSDATGRFFVAYTDGLTLKEYEAKTSLKLSMFTDKELDAKLEKYEESLKKVTETTLERFEDMLNCLPPQRWTNVEGYNIFMISEATTGNLHSHYIKKDGKAWEIMASKFDSIESIINKVKLAA